MNTNIFEKKLELKNEESKEQNEIVKLNHGFNRPSEFIDEDNIFNFGLHSNINVNLFLDNNNNIQNNLNNDLSIKSNNEINLDMNMDIEIDDKFEENSISNINVNIDKKICLLLIINQKYYYLILLLHLL